MCVVLRGCADGRVEYVRRLKESSESLRVAGERLGKLQIERRLALEQDDTQRAQLKERHITEYRKQLYAALDIDALLEKKGVSPIPSEFSISYITQQYGNYVYYIIYNMLCLFSLQNMTPMSRQIFSCILIGCI